MATTCWAWVYLHPSIPSIWLPKILSGGISAEEASGDVSSRRGGSDGRGSGGMNAGVVDFSLWASNKGSSCEHRALGESNRGEYKRTITFRNRKKIQQDNVSLRCEKVLTYCEKNKETTPDRDPETSWTIPVKGGRNFGWEEGRRRVQLAENTKGFVPKVRHVLRALLKEIQVRIECPTFPGFGSIWRPHAGDLLSQIYPHP